MYDGPAGVIGFRPVWQPDEYASLFTAAEGWGLFTQCRSGKTQTGQIKVVEGRLRVATLVFQLPPDAGAKSVEVRLAGELLGATSAMRGTDLRLTLAKPIVFESGRSLDVTIGM